MDLQKIQTSKKWMTISYAIAIAAIVIAIVLYATDHLSGRAENVLFWSAVVAYLLYLFFLDGVAVQLKLSRFLYVFVGSMLFFPIGSLFSFFSALLISNREIRTYGRLQAQRNAPH
jgi:hypothetical protein